MYAFLRLVYFWRENILSFLSMFSKILLSSSKMEYSRLWYRLPNLGAFSHYSHFSAMVLLKEVIFRFMTATRIIRIMNERVCF